MRIKFLKKLFCSGIRILKYREKIMRNKMRNHMGEIITLHNQRNLSVDHMKGTSRF